MATTQRLDAYPLTPGADYFTGSIRTPCIDTGLDIDRHSKYGRVYVSEDTISNWARLFDWISPDDAKTLQASLDERDRTIVELTERLAELRTLQAALTRAGFKHDDDDIMSFPHHKGSGWYLFSDGSTQRCTRDEADRVEAVLVEGGSL